MISAMKVEAAAAPVLAADPASVVSAGEDGAGNAVFSLEQDATASRSQSAPFPAEMACAAVQSAVAHRGNWAYWCGMANAADKRMAEDRPLADAAGADTELRHSAPRAVDLDAGSTNDADLALAAQTAAENTAWLPNGLQRVPVDHAAPDQAEISPNGRQSGRDHASPRAGTAGAAPDPAILNKAVAEWNPAQGSEPDMAPALGGKTAAEPPGTPADNVTARENAARTTNSSAAAPAGSTLPGGQFGSVADARATPEVGQAPRQPGPRGSDGSPYPGNHAPRNASLTTETPATNQGSGIATGGTSDVGPVPKASISVGQPIGHVQRGFPARPEVGMADHAVIAVNTQTGHAVGQTVSQMADQPSIRPANEDSSGWQPAEGSKAIAESMAADATEPGQKSSNGSEGIRAPRGPASANALSDRERSQIERSPAAENADVAPASDPAASRGRRVPEAQDPASTPGPVVVASSKHEPGLSSAPGLDGMPAGGDGGLSAATRADTTLGRDASGLSAAATASLPRHNLAHIAHLAAQYPDRPVELTLSPDELGSVRMTFGASDGALSMSIAADRPETLDLLRRHIDLLAQDFRDLGLGDVSFHFSSGSEGRTGQHEQFGAAPSLSSPDFAAEDPVPHRTMLGQSSAVSHDGGLDMRL